MLQYQKRNVFGFSLDFAEDVTKSNWSSEMTWIANNQYNDNDSFAGRSSSDTVNLTVSVDRPTFINFLNPNRTFFFNSQVFFQYITDYKAGFTSNGPFNMLGTFTVQTGYFQDRLLPSVTFVYDLNSNSGAMLPQITYRFTENFSASVGMNFFYGRWETVDTAIAPLGVVGSEVGHMALPGWRRERAGRRARARRDLSPPPVHVLETGSSAAARSRPHRPIPTMNRRDPPGRRSSASCRRAGARRRFRRPLLDPRLRRSHAPDDGRQLPRRERQSSRSG